MHLLWLHCVAIGQLNSMPALQPPKQGSLGHAQRGRLLRVEPPGRVCQVADVAAGRPLFSQGRHLQMDREVVKAKNASLQYILWEQSPPASRQQKIQGALSKQADAVFVGCCAR
jgi:hypothetical protein